VFAVLDMTAVDKFHSEDLSAYFQFDAGKAEKSFLGAVDS